MKRYHYIIIVALLLTAWTGSISAADDNASATSLTDSVAINFRQSKWNLDLSLGDNAASLDSIDNRLTRLLNDSVYRLRHVSVFGGASPEGTVSFNKFLSEQRAATLFNWFDKYNQLTDLDKTFTYFGRDWEGVLRLAETDGHLPYRDETLSLLRSIVSEKQAGGGNEPVRSLERIRQLRDGIPYRHLYDTIFPKVRASKVVIEYDRIPAPTTKKAIAAKRDTVIIERIVEVRDTIYIDTCNK